MSSGSRHLDAGRAATVRAWVSLAVYTAAGMALDLTGEAATYYSIGLALIGGWSAGGEPLVAALSSLRHAGEGYAAAKARGKLPQV